MNGALSDLIVLIPLAPLLACLVSVLGLPRPQSHWPALIGSSVSLAASLAVTLLITDPQRIPQQPLAIFAWASLSGDVPLEIGLELQIDGLSALLLVTATFVSTLIVIHAAQPMPNEPDNHRFFAAVSLLLFATVMLLLSANFLELFFFWQLAGVAGYLLLGHRSESLEAAGCHAHACVDVHSGIGDLKQEHAHASVAPGKVFLVNRLADAAFLWGIFLIWANFESLEFSDVLFDAGKLADVIDRNPAAVGMICFCLVAGAVARCAQFPLFGWLHEASTASAPVHALLQGSLTMPAAAYLIARCMPLFASAPHTRLAMAFLGGFTSLLAAAVALTGRDLKHVLSYSTAGYFGVIFVGLALASDLGIGAAIFCLVVHSLVKASLFLSTGNVSRQTLGSTDFRHAGGLRHMLPTSQWMFLIGAVVLSSGFWGQNAILDAAGEVSRDASARQATIGLETADPELTMAPLGLDAGFLFQTVTWLVTAGLFLMAFALFRGFFLTFHHQTAGPATTLGQTAETPLSTRMPLVLLAGVGLIIGIGPVLAGRSNLLVLYLKGSWRGSTISSGEADLFTAGLSTLLALLAIAGAWMLYHKPTRWPERISGLLGPFTRLSSHRFYLDDFYVLFLILPTRGLAQLCRFLDWFLVDGLLLEAVTSLPGLMAKTARPMQNGLVQFYALSLMFCVAVLLSVLLWLRG